MAIVTLVDTFDTTSSARSRGFFRIKELLKNSANWVVRGSSDGTTGGMDDTDRWTTETSADNSNSWLVLESPHPGPSDRIQVMFQALAGTSNWAMMYNPNADWSGGGAGIEPTSALGDTDVYTDGINGGDFARIHILADDVFPYGFAAYQVNRVTVPSDRLAICVAPLVTTPTAAGKPYAVYGGRSFKLNDVWNNRSNFTNSGWVAQRLQPATGCEFATALTWQGAVPNNDAVPGNILPNPSGNDFTFPLAFSRLDLDYHGASNFARIVGHQRTPYVTNNSLERISFGLLTFPWDGVTRPNPYYRPSDW